MPVLLNNFSLDMSPNPGINVTSLLGGAGSGVLALSDSGAAETISATVPGGYTTLTLTDSVNATILGNGIAGFAATFGANDTVSFNSNGGSGTVTANAPNDFVDVTGTTWSVTGYSSGGDTINSTATNSHITTSGAGAATNGPLGADTTPSNVVGLGGANATVSANGTNDLVETFGYSDVISVNGSANVLVNDGNATVYATSASTVVNAFFNQGGGTLDFINNSNHAATVSGGDPGTSGGQVTAFGGAHGGLYIGGSGGSNSLVGGLGQVNLIAAGTTSFLSVMGGGLSYATQNILQAGAGNATMIGGASSGYNEFYGGAGTDVMSTSGSGDQTFYVGSASETMTGSHVTGANAAVNQYFFNQDYAGGGGTAVITNFRIGTDHIYINGNGGLTGVSIASGSAINSGTGTLIQLNNGTLIKLIGVTDAQFNAATVAGGLSL